MMSPDKATQIKLYLSESRPLDAVQAIEDTIIFEAKESLNGITDVEILLQERRALRADKESLEGSIKRLEATYAKSNKQREAYIKKWDGFVSDVVKSSKKHGIDFDEFPSYVTFGKSFIEKLQNIKPDSFAKVDGLRLPQQRPDSLLDDKKIELFRVDARSAILEEIIARKHKAHRELFSQDAE